MIAFGALGNRYTTILLNLLWFPALNRFEAIFSTWTLRSHEIKRVRFMTWSRLGLGQNICWEDGPLHVLQLDHAVLHLLDEKAEASHEVPSFLVLTCHVLAQYDGALVVHVESCWLLLRMPQFPGTI